MYKSHLRVVFVIEKTYFFNFSIIFHFWYFTFLFLFDIIVIG